MRVLMVVGRSTGGIGGHVDALVHDLRGLGVEVSIVTDASTAEHFGWAQAERLWPFRTGVGLLRAPIDWHRIMRRAGGVDVVHAHGHQAAVVAAAAVARARPRPAFVVSLHNDLPPAAIESPASAELHSRSGDAAGDAPGGPNGSTASAKVHSRSGSLRGLGRRAHLKPLGAAIRWALRRADLVTGASPDLVDLARHLGAPTVDLATVASPRVAELLGSVLGSVRGAPAELRRGLLADAGIDDPGHPLVLTVSRLAPQKDLTTLVRAARQSRCPATWVVIGGGDASVRAGLEEELSGIRDGGGAATVHLVGPRADVTPWLRAADVFALSSRWEARALVVQEAMAAGLPVVATRVGGLPGLVGEAGLLVEPGDPVALAAAVDEVLGDPARAAELGAAARLRAATWETPEGEARRWADRYAGLPRA